MITKRIGNIGEAKVLAKFVELGVPVYMPFGDTEKADLVADFNGKLQKIQIKTTSTLQDGFYNVDIRNCKNHVCCPNPRQLYNEDEIDYFVSYCIPRDTICIFAIKDFSDKTLIRVRYEKPERETSNIHYEKDYLLDNLFNTDEG